jgi:hypothetical protein
MTISQEVQLIMIHKRTVQEQLFQAQTFMFQTVYSDPFHHQVMAVLCLALHLHIFLLSLPLSSLAKQAVLMEVLFTFHIAVANVFCMGYVVMIVAQIPITCLRTFKLTMLPRARIMSIIHQFHAV